MMFEIFLLIISILTLISAGNFIIKSTSNITQNLGIPEYLASTIVLCFFVNLPLLIIMLISNFYNISELGISAVIGSAVTILTLTLGILLLTSEFPIKAESHRNITFMWSSALVLFIVSLDKIIDRMDAIFLLLIFIFYTIYIYYRTSKAKEYTFLKIKPIHIWMYPIAIFAIILSSLALTSATILLDKYTALSYCFIGLIPLGFIIALPTIYGLRRVFTNEELAIDSIIGSIIICLSLIPGITALILPITYSITYNTQVFPLLFLNLMVLTFAIIAKAFRKINRAAGIGLIVSYLIYIILIIYHM